MVDPVDEIKGRLGIVELVSQYVQLKKAGQNFKGLCPFHGEKTPSFVVSPEKQICHCFGCNKGGDIFTFIQEVEGINFVEALQVLADKVGVRLEKKHMKSGGGTKSEKDDFYRAHELACAFYEKQLFHSNAGEKVLKYLKSRGIKDETIREFRLGFAPDDFKVLHSHLLEKGIPKKVLVKSGFVSTKNLADDRVYDKFRARLMFPIFDYLGRICGFGGRALKKEQMPKYLNSPENMIYNKSNILYGLSHAKKYVKEENSIILVEGYFDMILPYQEGVKNVAATSGTALTAQQVKQIKRITNQALTCFDADDAGFEATKRAYVLLNEQEFSVKTTSDFKGKDPADFVKEDPEAFKQKLKSADDFITFYVQKVIENHDITRIQDRREVLSELLPYYKKMTATTRDFYIRDLAQKLNLPETAIYDEIAAFRLPENHPARFEENVSEQNDSGPVKMRMDELILGIILFKPKIFPDLEEKINQKYFIDDVNTIYKELTNQYNLSRKTFDSWDLESENLTSFKQKIDVWTMYCEMKYQDFSEGNLKKEVENLLERLEREILNNELSKLKALIKEAEQQDDKTKLLELLNQQQELLATSKNQL